VISQQQTIYNDIDEVRTFFQKTFLTNIKEAILLQILKKSKKFLKMHLKKLKVLYGKLNQKALIS
jgi:hypothetical protein